MPETPTRAFARVYAHGAIQAFAETGGGVFLFVFLLKAGISVPLVLCSIAAINLLRLLLRSAVLPLARRIGLRNALILGTLLESSSYWLVPYVDGPGPVFGALILFGSMGSVTYWTTYHTYVAATGDSEARGGQVGVIEALAALAAVIAPALVTLLIVTSGPKAAFAAAALVQMAAALPLLGAPAVRVPELAGKDHAGRRLGMRLYLFDGFHVAGAHYLWQIALFVTLGESFGSYGGAMVVAGLAGAAMSLATGRIIDLGHGRRAVLFAYAAALAAACAKALSYSLPAPAVVAAAFGAVAAAVQIPAMMARVYNLAQASPCPLRFHMAAEAGWDIGAASGCLAAAALIALGVPVGTPVLLAVLGLAGTAVLLWQSYGTAESQKPPPSSR